MSILATAPSGGRRKGPGGRWEVYASGKGWVPEESLSLDELARLQEAPRAPQSAQEPRQEPNATTEPPAEPDRRVRGKAVQVRIDGKWIAESCVAVWEAYGRLRSVSAVARELGMGQGNVSNRLQRYEEVFGVARPEPDKRPSAGRPLPTRAVETAESVAPRSESGKAKQGRREDARKGGPTDPAQALSEPAADHASVLHPSRADGRADIPASMPADYSETIPLADENDEPVAVSGSEHRTEAPGTGNGQPDDDVIFWAHRDGYARGYAVATLRVLSHTTVIDQQLRDMASDAADGLMA